MSSKTKEEVKVEGGEATKEVQKPAPKKPQIKVRNNTGQKQVLTMDDLSVVEFLPQEVKEFNKPIEVVRTMFFRWIDNGILVII